MQLKKKFLLMNSYKEYTGKTLTKGALITGSSNAVDEVIPPYLPGDNLIKAVEYARILKRPLLLRGEPGSGKTRLAQAVAYELYGDNYRSKYFEWYVKSTSKAIEGLYKIDHIKRLRDAQRRVNIELSSYCELGPLGKAFKYSTHDEPCVLLIDEVDKADIDFPNDLLLELDQKRFYITETSEEIVAHQSPIIIVTSNDEKELPNAFLRRCIFCYVEFPKENELIEILNAHLKASVVSKDQELKDSDVKVLVERFLELHSEMLKTQSDKKASTSELIDWGKIIQHYYLKNQFDFDELKKGNLPYAEVLLKTLEDYKQYHKNNLDVENKRVTLV